MLQTPTLKVFILRSTQTPYWSAAWQSLFQWLTHQFQFLLCSLWSVIQHNCGMTPLANSSLGDSLMGSISQFLVCASMIRLNSSCPSVDSSSMSSSASANGVSIGADPSPATTCTYEGLATVPISPTNLVLLGLIQKQTINTPNRN